MIWDVIATTTALGAFTCYMYGAWRAKRQGRIGSIPWMSGGMAFSAATVAADIVRGAGLTMLAVDVGMMAVLIGCLTFVVWLREHHPETGGPDCV